MKTKIKLSRSKIIKLISNFGSLRTRWVLPSHSLHDTIIADHVFSLEFDFKFVHKHNQTKHVQLIQLQRNVSNYFALCIQNVKKYKL